MSLSYINTWERSSRSYHVLGIKIEKIEHVLHRATVSCYKHASELSSFIVNKLNQNISKSHFTNSQQPETSHHGRHNVAEQGASVVYVTKSGDMRRSIISPRKTVRGGCDSWGLSYLTSHHPSEPRVYSGLLKMFFRENSGL